MAKVQMVCPFSKKACIECGVFRGRHRYICFAPELGGDTSTWSKTKWFKVDGRKRNLPIEKPPILTPSPKWLTNLEDCMERRKG
jgi:hypothetical protein